MVLYGQLSGLSVYLYLRLSVCTSAPNFGGARRADEPDATLRMSLAPSLCKFIDKFISLVVVNF